LVDEEYYYGATDIVSLVPDSGFEDSTELDLSCTSLLDLTRAKVEPATSRAKFEFTTSVNSLPVSSGYMSDVSPRNQTTITITDNPLENLYTNKSIRYLEFGKCRADYNEQYELRQALITDGL